MIDVELKRKLILRYIPRFMKRYSEIQDLCAFHNMHDDSYERNDIYGYAPVAFNKKGVSYIAYGNVFRKLFLLIVLQLCKMHLIDINITELMDMPLDMYGDIEYVDQMEHIGEVFECLLGKLFEAYNYSYEQVAYDSQMFYGIEPEFEDDIVDDEAAEDMEVMCFRIEECLKTVMDKKDFDSIHDSYGLIYCSVNAYWSLEKLPKRFYILRYWNDKISEYMRLHGKASEDYICEQIRQLQWLYLDDYVSNYPHMDNERYVFHAVKYFVEFSDEDGAIYYCNALDGRYINVGHMLAIPLIAELLN